MIILSLNSLLFYISLGKNNSSEFILSYEPPKKRTCLDTRSGCIIHCTDESGELSALHDIQSWKSLLRAAEIRQYKPILDLVESLKDEEIPDICYHRKCRSIFTMKKDLERISKDEGTSCNSKSSTSQDRRSSRGPSAKGTTYERICIFCNKESKYGKGKQTREKLIQCSDLRSDQMIRNVATANHDTKILAIVSRELVAAEACYHKSCYRNYTRPVFEEATYIGSAEDKEYNLIESKAHQKLFNHIRSNVLENPRLVKLTEITQQLVLFMQELGAREIRESTKTHLRRKLESEFKSLLLFEDLLGNNRLFVVPETLSKLQLAKEVAHLLEEKISSNASKTEVVHQAALDLRETILSTKDTISWPPKQSELTVDAVAIPDNVRSFLSTLPTGNREKSSSQRVQRLVNSFGQDLVFGVSCGRVKTPKHILLPYAVKSLTNNVELIQIVNRCGHGMSYSQIEELNTALCLQKLAATPENMIPLPDNIKPYISTSLAWDNIDRLEETLSGEGTSHRVNGIAIQARHFGPHLPPIEATPNLSKSKRRSVDVVLDKELPIYNAGERCGPPSRAYVEVASSEIEAKTWKKNFLWILVRLHAAENQTISGWTGFNITVRNQEEVSKDNIGYLPTIDAPATNMSTVFEVLSQSQRIKNSLKLNTIVVVFDQALYAKATEIKWKHSEQFGDVILRMGAFHTICMFLGIIGKRFQDAGLRDLCVESQVIVEGSVSGVLEGRRYNRAVRLHKLVYEALMRQAWSGFRVWIAEKHNDKAYLVEDMFVSLQSLRDNVCAAEFQTKFCDNSFSKVTELFRRYMLVLRHENGKLSEFWMSYLDLIDLLLAMIRASREGDWDLHISSIRNFIPWCFAYDNINYARYLSSYLSEMSHLEDEHPEVLAYLKSGGFAVQIGEDNPFGRIPVDQACEETVNKDTQTPGGTKGFSLKPKAVNKYYLVAEYRSIFMRNLKDMLYLSKSSCQHSDLQKSRIARDEADVQSLLSTLEPWRAG